MYVPRHFAEERTDVLVELVRVAAFGHLVVPGPGGLVSTPLPFVIDDAATSVRAHLARPNPVWQLAPCDALLIVPVSDAYVSPGWYPSKTEHGKVVPTWNYEVVHLHGRLEAHDDPEWLHAQVRDLTDRHERTMPNSWSVDDAPADYVEQMLRGIIGIAVEITRIEGKRKLSQNRESADRAGAIEGLALSGRSGSSVVADAMRRT